jgi:hypothetical protein
MPTNERELIAAYDLNENGEADNVYRFCSSECRNAYKGYYGELVFSDGVDIDAIPGTVCDQCGVILIKEVIQHANRR